MARLVMHEIQKLVRPPVGWDILFASGCIGSRLFTKRDWGERVIDS